MMSDDANGKSLNECYYARFGEMPTTAKWDDDLNELDALMEKAIKDGKALTVEDLYRAQGIIAPPLPPEAYT